MSKYILAIDQGTTSSRVFLYDKRGRVVGLGQAPFAQHFPQPAWVEHDLEEIWASVEVSAKEALRSAGVPVHEVAGIGVTNQRETVGLWNRQTGKPLAPAIVWQCRRTADLCEKLKAKKNLEKKVNALSGLWLDPYFSGTKIQWLLQNKDWRAKAEKGQICAGTIDTFLLHRLTGGVAFATDVTNASRTLLMNLKTLNWDDQLLKIFKIPRICLPQIQPTSSEFGRSSGTGVFGHGVPILSMVGDQQSALFGQTAWRKGEVKCTFGTGSFILLNTGDKPILSKNRLITTVAWQIKGRKPNYALEGGAFVCGAAVQWLRDGLGLISDSKSVESLAEQVVDTGGVWVVPALSGLGAPHWRADARGVILGLSRATTKAHLARALLEGMALQNADILSAMQSDGNVKLQSLRVDGGATENSLLMQMQADFLNTKVLRPKDVETTVRGAAWLAGLQAEFWTEKDLQAMNSGEQTEFLPKLSTKDRRQKLGLWRKAVSHAVL